MLIKSANRCNFQSLLTVRNITCVRSSGHFLRPCNFLFAEKHFFCWAYGRRSGDTRHSLSASRSVVPFEILVAWFMSHVGMCLTTIGERRGGCKIQENDVIPEMGQSARWKVWKELFASRECLQQMLAGPK